MLLRYRDDHRNPREARRAETRYTKEKLESARVLDEIHLLVSIKRVR